MCTAYYKHHVYDTHNDRQHVRGDNGTDHPAVLLASYRSDREAAGGTSYGIIGNFVFASFTVHIASPFHILVYIVA